MKVLNFIKLAAPMVSLATPLALISSCATTNQANLQDRDALIINFKQLNFTKPLDQIPIVNQIDPNWIILNQSKIIDQNQFYLSDPSQISHLKTALIANQLLVKFAINQSASKKPLDDHQALTYHQFVIDQIDPNQAGFSYWRDSDLTPISAKIQIDAKASNLTFKNLSSSAAIAPRISIANYDAITLSQQAHIFDKQWFFDHRYDLFSGNLDLITTYEDFYFSNDLSSQARSNQSEQPLIEAAKDGKSMKIYVGIKPLVHFQNKHFSPTSIMLAISITNLKAIDQPDPITNFYPTTISENINVLSLGLFNDLETVIQQINRQWIYDYRNALLSGTTSLIKSAHQIELKKVEKLNRHSIRIQFELAPFSYISDKLQVGSITKAFSTIIIGFDPGYINQPLVPNRPKPQPNQPLPPQGLPFDPPPLAPINPFNQVLKSINQQLMDSQLKTDQFNQEQLAQLNQSNVLSLLNNPISVPEGYQLKLINWQPPTSVIIIQFELIDLKTNQSLISEARSFPIQIIQPTPFRIWDQNLFNFNNKSFWNQVEKINPTLFQKWKAPQGINGQIYNLDLGQASGVLIKLYPSDPAQLNEQLKVANSFNILIDAGNFQAETDQNQALYTFNYQQKLKPTLQQYLGQNDKIDLFVFSHIHSDHIGQAAEVLKDFAIANRSVVINWGDIEQNSKTYQKMMLTISDLNLIYADPQIEQTINLASAKPLVNNPYYGQVVDNIWQPDQNHLLKIVPRQTLVSFSPQSYFTYLAPTFDYQPNQPNQSPNLNSINTYLKIDNYRALFSGDSEGQTQNDLLNLLWKIDPNFQGLDYYLAAHHGSTTAGSNQQSFLASVLKSGTKIVVQANDQKLFGDVQPVPTLRWRFFENLLNVAKLFNLNLDQSVYLNQNLGDIIFNIANNKVKTEFLSRQTQIAKGLINVGSTPVSTKKATLYRNSQDPNRYEDLLAK